jgi:hypothetical protein
VVIRASSNPAALDAVKSGAADVMGSIKPVLFDLSSQLPGSRVSTVGQASIRTLWRCRKDEGISL